MPRRKYNSENVRQTTTTVQFRQDKYVHERERGKKINRITKKKTQIEEKNHKNMKVTISEGNAKMKFKTMLFEMETRDT